MALLLSKCSQRRLLSSALSCQSALEARTSIERPKKLLPASLLQWQFYSRPRGPLWRGKKGIGKEALYVLSEVKRNKNDSVSLGNTFHSKVARLLKADLLAVLKELQRQNEVDLALRVFETARKEVWYRPDIYFYKDMLHCLAKAKRVDDCNRLLKNLKAEGLPPDGLLLTEVMTAYLECNMLPEAMETFDAMRQGSVPPDLPAFKVLLRFLKKMGKDDLRKKIKAESLEFYEGIVESKFKRRQDSDDDEAELGTKNHESQSEEEFDWNLNKSAHDEDQENDDDEEMRRLQRTTDEEIEEDDVSAMYTESDDEELQIGRHLDKKYSESDESDLEMRRHQSAKFEKNE